MYDNRSLRLRRHLQENVLRPDKLSMKKDEVEQEIVTRLHPLIGQTQESLH